MEPSETEITELALREKLWNIMTWAGMDADEAKSFGLLVGYSDAAIAEVHPRVFGSIAWPAIEATLANWQVNDTKASLVQKGKVRLLFDTVQFLFKPPVPQAAASNQPGSVADAKVVAEVLQSASKTPQRKVSMSLVIDPADDTDDTEDEDETATNSQVTTMMKDDEIMRRTSTMSIKCFSLRIEYEQECPDDLKAKYSTQEFKDKCDKLFADADTDGNGTLDLEELREPLHKYLSEESDFDLNFLFRAFDEDKSDAIEKDEFYELMRHMKWKHHVAKEDALRSVLGCPF